MWANHNRSAGFVSGIIDPDPTKNSGFAIFYNKSNIKKTNVNKSVWQDFLYSRQKTLCVIQLQS